MGSAQLSFESHWALAMLRIVRLSQTIKGSRKLEHNSRKKRVKHGEKGQNRAANGKPRKAKLVDFLDISINFGALRRARLFFNEKITHTSSKLTCEFRGVFYYY
jgi:hypothetical protein